jgi:molybdenum cofactor cytidylyltransferase
MPRIGAVLLAAGASTRFGSGSKLLADFGGEPLVRRVARRLLDCALTDLLVVTGREPEACRRALEQLPLRFAHNADWQGGMGVSIATGVAALEPGLGGVFIVPGDMPFLSAALLTRMQSAFDRSGAHAIVYPATPDGEQRNPVLWPARLFDALASLSGREGAKPLLVRHAGESIAVCEANLATFADVDTAADLEAARARLLSPPSLDACPPPA